MTLYVAGMDEVPTPAAMQCLLATVIAGVAGGQASTWQRKIGPVTKLPLHSNIRCNWMVEPTGTTDELFMIAKAVEIVRGEHPYVAG